MMPPPFAIRVLTPGDAEDYRAIRLATLATEPAYFGSLYATGTARPLPDFAKALNAATILGATRAGPIAGTIRFQAGTGAKERHKGSIGGFFVRPECRGQGLGGALMSAALAVARTSVEHVTLSVVRENEAAIALYRRFGFETYGIEPRARRSDGRYQDVVLMWLPLTAAPDWDTASDR